MQVRTSWPANELALKRHSAQRVTNETYRWVSDARFHPSGDGVIATKWYTSSRSLGAGEGWQYAIPELGSSPEIKAGDGERLVGRTLPPGWGPERYGDQQIGPEQFIWKGNDTLIYSKNVADTNGAFTYSKGADMQTQLGTRSDLAVCQTYIKACMPSSPPI